MSNLTNRTVTSDEENTTHVVISGDSGYEYTRSAVRFWVYTGVWFLQVVVGIMGNVLTLLIIFKLKPRLNAHITMVYLAASYILSSCTMPIYIYVSATETGIIVGANWTIICLVSEALICIAYLGCFFSYLILSVDR